jgi:hypothetical protein
MPDILVRNVTDSIVSALDALAQASGLSREAYLRQLLADAVADFDPGLVLGYVQLSDGELDAGALCPECQQEFGNRGVFIGFNAALRLFGPVCGSCATTQ